MFPLKDTIRSRSFPLVNTILIILNIIAFIYQLNLPSGELSEFVLSYGFIPARMDWLNPLSYIPVFTSMFLHGGWFHIISNLWILFIFGDNVEDRIGSARYLVFYLLGGVAAMFLQYIAMPNSLVPAIGASGAIAAVLGAYFLFFPRARIITLIPVFILPWFVDVPAILFLGFWFIAQLFSGLVSLAAITAQTGGIAWWAHIGGFIFGLLMAFPFSFRRPAARWYADQYWPW